MSNGRATAVGFSPYFEGGAPPPTDAQEAFIRVRVGDGPKANGSVAVYLDSGTQLIVRRLDLLRLDLDER